MHMWNVVQVEGAWYHLDATWSDSDTLVNYKYFNVTDEMIQNDHVIYDTYFGKDGEDSQVENAEYGNIRLPVCNSLDANYYASKAVRINSYDRSADAAIVAAIEAAARKGEESFSVYIGKDLAFDEAVDKMFSEYPYKLTNCIRRAARNLGIEINYRESVFVADETTRGITVKIQYENDE